MDAILTLINVIATTIKVIAETPVLLGAILLGLAAGHLEKKCH